MERLDYSMLTEVILRLATEEQKRRGNTNLAYERVIQAAARVLAGWRESGEALYEEGERLQDALASDPDGVRAIVERAEKDITLGNREGDAIFLHGLLIRASDRARQLERDALTADILVETILQSVKR